jgi:hypothetical protein
MSSLRFVLAAFALAAVSACASVPANPLTVEQRAALRVSDVKVAFADGFKAPDIIVRMRYFDQYKAEYGELVHADVESSETAPKKGRLTREYISIALREEIKKAFAADQGGDRPAAVSLTVKDVKLTDGPVVVLVRSNTIDADAAILDAVTQRKLAGYDNIVAFNGGVGGVASVAMEAMTAGGAADDAAEAYARELHMRFNKTDAPK